MVKGDHPAAQLGVGRADQPETGKVADPGGDGLVEQQLLLLDGIEADLLQVFGRRAQPDDAGVILQAGLKLFGRGQKFAGGVGGGSDRVAAHQERLQRLEEMVFAVQPKRDSVDSPWLRLDIGTNTP